MRSDLRSGKTRGSQRGYMMITLMLMVALASIAALTLLPQMAQQIKRDREEEMIHRGTAYMRAIQHYYKKLGRYPNSVDDLLNTNNMRFLRKRYTDPMNVDRATGKEKDFRFLHQQDIALNNGPVLPGQAPGQGAGQSPFGSPSPFGGAQSSGSQPAGGSTTNGDSANSPGGQGNSNSAGSSSSSNSASGFNGPTFGGGPILGVASADKKDTSIRVFFDKSHYSDWLFIYVPGMENAGLLKGPVNPNMPAGGGLTPGIPGMPGAPGTGSMPSPFGSTPNPGQSPISSPPQSNPGQTSPQQ